MGKKTEINSFTPMNRVSFPPHLLLFLLALILGETDAFGQYYPPAVTVANIAPSNNLLLTGGAGSYSGGYNYDFTYEATVSIGGYWDYNHQEITLRDRGYSDNANGYYGDDGIWVAPWISNVCWDWDTIPVYIPVSTETVTVPGSAHVTVTLYIDSNGNVSMSTSDNSSTNNLTNTWGGVYNFSTGIFSSGGYLPPLASVNSDGSSWSPPPPPPNYPSYGPPRIWVEGVNYGWVSTSFNDPYHTSGTDYYSDASGHSVWFQSSDGGASNNVGGNTPAGWWSGTATNGVFEDTGTLDVRGADASGNYLQATAPSGLPPLIRVDGSTSLWNYIGQGASLHHYAGDQPDQRLTIDPTSGTVSIQNDSNSAFYSQNVIWSSTGGRDLRAVSLDGTLWQTGHSPSWGPAAILVFKAVWRYVGTWDGSVTAFPGSTAPVIGDHYLGDNNGQRLVVNSSGAVTVFGTDGETTTGTYAPQSTQAGAPEVFTVNGYTIYPGDLNGAFFRYQPSVGPPAIWVNGTIFPFANTKEMVSQLGTWVDTYADGNGNSVTVSTTEVRAFQADRTSNWAGRFVPEARDAGNGGIFVIKDNFRYDVRSSNGVSLIAPQSAPHNLHPYVVKVDGNAWNFAGSITDTDSGGTIVTDYYFGANPGERLWIDSTGAVRFTNSVTSQNLSGSGNFLGSVFLVQGHDLRACTSDAMAVTPVGSPQWGPAALWVEGVTWPFIGSVSDGTLQVHADYYGGSNAGQVVSVDSAMQVSGASTGVFNDGVFVVNGGKDLRALDAAGAQSAPVGAPAHDYPANLRIGGLHWNFIGTSSGVNYYAEALGGQRLSVDATGAVVYSDHPHGVNNATGTYTNGVFTSTGGGLSFNAGTIVSDLDILGNIISFGTLTGNATTAGVTLQFQDTQNSLDQSRTATLYSSLARPNAQWQWGRAGDSSGQRSQHVMLLDSSSKLTLYDAAGNQSMVLDASPDGQSAIKGVLRVRPGGDLQMAPEFRWGTQP